MSYNCGSSLDAGPRKSETAPAVAAVITRGVPEIFKKSDDKSWKNCLFI